MSRHENINAGEFWWNREQEQGVTSEAVPAAAVQRAVTTVPVMIDADEELFEELRRLRELRACGELMSEQYREEHKRAVMESLTRMAAKFAEK